MVKVMKAKVRDIEHVIFEGDVDRVSSYNEMGPFDVYPMHANFISIIRKEVILFNNGKILKDIKFGQAVMKVRQDLIRIYLGMEALRVEEESFTKTTTSADNK